MKKKKLLIIVGVIILIIAIGVTIFFCVKKDNNNNQSNEDMLNNGVPNTGLEVTGKLKEYIINLGDDYYIKYSGKFKNNSGELVQAIVEYTKSGKNFAVRSSELDMHLICIGDNIYTISSRYELIVKMPKEHVDISEYNLVSDLGQAFAYEYKEKINNIEYDVEEYVHNGKTLKYYFNGNDVKIINYDGLETKIIRVENRANTDILTIPTSYELIDNTQN